MSKGCGYHEQSELPCCFNCRWVIEGYDGAADCGNPEFLEASNHESYIQPTSICDLFDLDLNK